MGRVPQRSRGVKERLVPKRLGRREGQGLKSVKQIIECRIMRMRLCTHTHTHTIPALMMWLSKSQRKRHLPGLGGDGSPAFPPPRVLPGLWSRLPSYAGRRWPQGTPPCPAWASSVTPGPGRSPWLSPNPLMSSVKTPGSLSMRHHSPALPVMAPATHRPAPPPTPGAPAPASASH